MALREINLVPSNILARRELIRHCSFWIGCLILLLAPILGIYVYQAQADSKKNRAFANPDDINKHLIQQIEAIKRIQEELTLLNNQQADLQNVVGHSEYSRILYKLADTVNTDTWLNSLQIDSGNKPKAPVAIRLSGYAISNEALGHFLNRLSSDPLFHNVELNHAREALKEKSKVNDKRPEKQVKFEIACVIKLG